jgi:hypothetical protein
MWCECEGKLVGATGFEPATSSSRTKRATKLRHAPTRVPVDARSMPPETEWLKRRPGPRPPGRGTGLPGGAAGGDDGRARGKRA